MRLIDADELKKCFCDICNAEFPCEPCEPDICEPYLFIQEQEAIEIVKCENCRHHGCCFTEDVFYMNNVDKERMFCGMGKEVEK